MVLRWDENPTRRSRLDARGLTREQHIELARRLTDAENALIDAARIVRRPRYTERVLLITRRMQTQLVEPLHEAWGDDFSCQGNPHSVGDYSLGPAMNEWKMRLR